MRDDLGSEASRSVAIHIHIYTFQISDFGQCGNMHIYIYNNGQIPRSQEPRAKSQGQGAMTQQPHTHIYIYTESHAIIPCKSQRPKDPRAKDQQPRTERRGPCKSQGPGTKDQEPWTMSPAGTKKHMHAKSYIRTKSPGPSAKRPRAMDQEPCKDQEPHAKSQGPRAKDRATRTKSEGPRAKDQ